MPATPRVSVIVPCHNLGQYLDEAVDSVLAQTYQDFEDYLVDKAQGQFLCPLDADDRLRPTFLEKTVETLDANPKLAFAAPRLRTFGGASYLWPLDERCDLNLLLCEHTIITPALVRRDAVVQVGGYDEAMPAQGDEDWDLCISLLEAGHRGVVLPDVLFDYRQRPGSMGAVCTTGQTHLDLMRYIFRKHRVSYDAHFFDVLLWKDNRIAEVRDDIRERQHRVGGFLESAVVARRAELEALRVASARVAQGQGLRA